MHKYKFIQSPKTILEELSTSYKIASGEAFRNEQDAEAMQYREWAAKLYSLASEAPSIPMAPREITTR